MAHDRSALIGVAVAGAVLYFSTRPAAAAALPPGARPAPRPPTSPANALTALLDKLLPKLPAARPPASGIPNVNIGSPSGGPGRPSPPLTFYGPPDDQAFIGPPADLALYGPPDDAATYPSVDTSIDWGNQFDDPWAWATVTGDLGTTPQWWDVPGVGEWGGTPFETFAPWNQDDYGAGNDWGDFGGTDNS